MARPPRAHTDPTHLFVYGSLLRGSPHPMARLLRSQTHYVGEGSFTGRLFDLGPYPAAIAAAGARLRVRGEVYRLGPSPRLIAALDRYEGCDDPGPHAYVRCPVEVRLDRGGRIMAWAYLYNGDLTGYRVVPQGNYAAYRLRGSPAPVAERRPRDRSRLVGGGRCTY